MPAKSARQNGSRQNLGYPYADLSKMPVSLDAVRIIPETEARDGKIAAIEVRDDKIAVVVVNPDTARDEKSAGGPCGEEIYQ